MIHVDTNFLIALENPASRATALLQNWMTTQEQMGVSSLVWAEYLCGPLGDAKIRAAEFLFPRREPFTTNDAPLAARLFNHGGRRKGTLVDCMIAAVALRCGATFATLNPADFSRFKTQGLSVLDASES